VSEALFSFILFAAVATLTPGGATTLATASGVQFGFRRSIPLMFGIASGLALLTIAAASGLSALLQTLPGLALTMKLMGTGYLLWLARKISMAGAPQTTTYSRDRPVNFFGGILMLALNPKGWTMALGAAASFTAISPDPVVLALIMGAIFATASVVSLCLWCATGTLLAKALHNERQWRMVNIALGLLLAASILQMWTQ